MNRTFQTYIDRLAAAEEVAPLVAALAEIGVEAGLGKVAYLGLPPGPLENGPILLTTYEPSWGERYLQQGYQRFDLVVKRASESSMPFEWGLQEDTQRMNQEQLQLFDEAAEFGIVRGFTVPVHHSSGQVAAVTFASDEPEWAFRRGIMKNRYMLHLAGMYFHMHVSRVVARTSTEAVAKLTRRELQCLTWASRGKSATDIGSILRISRHTAVFHLENAKRKLGVRTAYQAIALLAAAGPAYAADPM